MRSTPPLAPRRHRPTIHLNRPGSETRRQDEARDQRDGARQRTDARRRPERFDTDDEDDRQHRHEGHQETVQRHEVAPDTDDVKRDAGKEKAEEPEDPPHAPRRQRQQWPEVEVVVADPRPEVGQARPPRRRAADLDVVGVRKRPTVVGPSPGVIGHENDTEPRTPEPVASAGPLPSADECRQPMQTDETEKEHPLRPGERGKCEPEPARREPTRPPEA